MPIPIIFSKRAKRKVSKTADSLLEREDTLFSNRINFFLVLQSMLLLSFTTLIMSKNDLGPLIGFFLNMLGLIITAYFLIIFRRTVYYIWYLRNDLLRKVDPIYDLIWKNRIYMYPDRIDRRANFLLAIGLPSVFFTVWFILLISSIGAIPIFFRIFIYVVYVILFCIFIKKQKN